MYVVSLLQLALVVDGDVEDTAIDGAGIKHNIQIVDGSANRSVDRSNDSTEVLLRLASRSVHTKQPFALERKVETHIRQMVMTNLAVDISLVAAFVANDEIIQQDSIFSQLDRIGETVCDIKEINLHCGLFHKEIAFNNRIFEGSRYVGLAIDTAPHVGRKRLRERFQRRHSDSVDTGSEVESRILLTHIDIAHKL